MLTKNDVTNAEILWCLKVVDRHFSHNSYSDCVNLLQCMFADSEIAQQLSLGKTKCRYMTLYKSRYSRMDQVKFVEDSL